MFLLGSEPGAGAGGNKKNWTSRDLCSTQTDSFHRQLFGLIYSDAASLSAAKM